MQTLEQGIAQYLEMRRAVGYELREQEKRLYAFAAFLREKGATHITTKLSLEFAKLRQRTQLPAEWARRLSAIRGFATYWRIFDDRTEVPSPRLLPFRDKRAVAHIFTDEEVKQLLEAAAYAARKLLLGVRTYPAIFGLLAATGMRIGEVLRLDETDVDLDAGILTVRDAKFRKSRHVPIHCSIGDILRQYREHRKRLLPKLETPSFFVSDKGLRLTHPSVEGIFIKASMVTGLRKPCDGKGPRLHDLRHSFAVKTLMQWYDAGLNVDQQMPVLSTYLGHVCPQNTYWYLHSVPELMTRAAARLEQQLGGLP